MEDAYLLLFEQNPLPMLIYDRASRSLLRLNRAARDLYGYTEEEIHHMKLEDLHAPEQRAFIHQALNSNASILRKVGVVQHRKKDGSLIDVDIVTYDVDYQGRPARLASMVDVTRAQQDQAELEQTRAMLETILANVAYGILVVTTPDRRIEFVNRVGAEMLGYAEGELIGQPIRVLFKDEAAFHHFASQIIPGALEGGTHFVEFETQRKDGSTFPIEIAVVTVNSENIQPARTLSVFRDISAAKQNEAERLSLTQERDTLLERLQLVLERMPLIVFITDGDMIVSYWNPASEKVFGYAEAEAIGRSAYDLIIPPRHHEEVRAAVRQVFATNTSVRRVNTNFTKDGREIIVEWHNTPLVQPSGEVVGLLSMGEDITEKQLAAHRLEESEQRFRSLFEESPVALWLVDFSAVQDILNCLRSSGATDLRERLLQHPHLLSEMNAAVKVVDANAAAVRLMRAQSKEHLLASLRTPIADDTLGLLIEQFATSTDKQPLPAFELAINALNGEQQYVMLRFQILQGYENSLERVLLSMANITQRRQVELAQLENLVKLNLLNQAAVAISHALDLQAMLQLVADWAERILNAEMAGVSLLTAKGDALELQAVRHTQAIDELVVNSPVGMRIKHPEFFAMLATGAPMRMGKEEFARLPHEAESRFMFGAPIEMNSFMAVPMLDESGTGIGALHLMQKTKGEFDANDEALAIQLAQIAAAAIEKQNLLDRLRTAEERMRALAQQVVGAQEQERQTIARELHDETGQNLTALKLALQMAAEDLQRGEKDVAGQIEDTIHLTDTITNQTREMARILRPPRLESISLEASLEGLCRDFGARMRVPIHYQDCRFPEMDTHMALTIYRFVQEGLTNIARHAHATQVWVTIACDAEKIDISIQDDGSGFDTGELEEQQGIGLRGMQERIALLKGHLSVRSRRGQGTRLSAIIPLEVEP